MFSSLPSALGFYSHSEDSKLTFRTKQAGIKRLFGPQVIDRRDVEYWSQYYTLFDSVSEVYSLMTLEDIRQAFHSSPENLQTLLLTLTDHLSLLLSSPAFPSVPSSKSSLSSYLPSNPASSTTKEALNCLRVIGRVLPVLYEFGWPPSNLSGFEQPAWVEDLLWKGEKQVVEPDRSGQFVIDDEDEEEENRPELGSQESTAVGPSWVDRLFEMTVDMLFCVGFTVPAEAAGQDGAKVSFCIWEKGIGSTVPLGNSAPYESNKIEVLRFLQILLSTPIYTPPPLLPILPSPPLQALTFRLPKRKTLSLLCSLLNTFLNPSQAGWLDGVKNVPFGYLVKAGLTGSIGAEGGASADRDQLRKGAAGVLLGGLDYWFEEGEEEESKGNSFRYFLAKLHRAEDFEFILKGIMGVFSQHLQRAHGLFSGSSNAPPLLLETFMLFWKLIDFNKKFRAFVLSDEKRTVDIMTYTVFTCLDLKDNPAHHGLLRMCAYILQTLSAEKPFGRAVAKHQVALTIPAKWVVHGTAADFMVVSIYSITTTSGLSSLFPALTISIANVAPYLQDLSVQASTKLVQLFTALTNPAFMLRDEGHPRLVNYLLETFDTVIFHQLSNNPNLIHALLGASHTFQFIATFTLKTGLQEIQRAQKARALAAEKAKRAERARGNGTSTNEKTSFLADMDPTPSTLELSRSLSNVTISTPSLGTTVPSGEDPTNLSADTPSSPEESTSVKPLSEKAKGKRKEGASEGLSDGEPDDDELDQELEQIRVGGLGSGGFVPTQEWVTSWQKGLPLDPILLMISELVPKVEALQTAKTQGPNKDINQFLRSVDLTGVLPPTSSISARKFLFSPTSLIWLTSLLWGEIYVAGFTPVGLWTGTSVKLFGVKSAPMGRRDSALQNLTSVFRTSTSSPSASSSPSTTRHGGSPSPRPEGRRRQSSGFSMRSLTGGNV